MLEHNPNTDMRVGMALNYLREHLDAPSVSCGVWNIGKRDKFRVQLEYGTIGAKWVYKFTVSPVDSDMGLVVFMESGDKEKVTAYMKEKKALDDTLEQLYITLEQAEDRFD